jgi:hypothetical protein
MNELTANTLYLLHVLIIWGGGVWQARYIFANRSAEDITLVWVVCLLVSELMALPRAIKSQYLVWKACYIVATILIAVLLLGVIMYG